MLHCMIRNVKQMSITCGKILFSFNASYFYSLCMWILAYNFCLHHIITFDIYIIIYLFIYLFVYHLFYEDFFTPQIRQDYPLNLSISVSGGKETNKDSLRNCEWGGISSNLESMSSMTSNCNLKPRCINFRTHHLSDDESTSMEGERPV